MSAQAEQRLRAAKDLLLRGERRLSNGALSVTNLAKEAGLSRATANRARTVRDEFLAKVKELQQADEATHPAVVAERLRRQLDEVRTQSGERIRALTAWADTLAQQVQSLALLLEREREAAARGSRAAISIERGRRRSQG